MASGRPGKLSMLISLLVLCGFTMRYTKNPAMADVATTAKNSSAKTAINNFVYHRVGNRISSRMDIVTRAARLPHYAVFSFSHLHLQKSHHAPFSTPLQL